MGESLQEQLDYERGRNKLLHDRLHSLEGTIFALKQRIEGLYKQNPSAVPASFSAGIIGKVFDLVREQEKVLLELSAAVGVVADCDCTVRRLAHIGRMLDSRLECSYYAERIKDYEEQSLLERLGVNNEELRERVRELRAKAEGVACYEYGDGNDHFPAASPCSKKGCSCLEKKED